MSAVPEVLLVGRFTTDDVRNRQVVRALESLGHQPILVNPPGGIVRRSWRQIRAARGRQFGFVVVPFLGYSSVPVAWVISRIKRVPLVFDAYILLHDTIVVDRGVVPRRSLRSALLRVLESLACRLADVVVVDTQQHAERFAQLTRVDRRRFAVVPVGSEHQTPCEVTGASEAVHVVYCGSFIPLHGLEHVVRAAALLRDRAEISFTFVGSGQMEPAIRALAQELECQRCTFVGPLGGAELRRMLCEATILLGVFGTSTKAEVVVPNKVVDALALGRPVLTATTPAIDAALSPKEYLGCPPGDPIALADVLAGVADGDVALDQIGRAGHAAFQRQFSDRAISEALRATLEQVGR